MQPGEQDNVDTVRNVKVRISIFILCGFFFPFFFVVEFDFFFGFYMEDFLRFFFEVEKGCGFIYDN